MSGEMDKPMETEDMVPPGDGVPNVTTTPPITTGHRSRKEKLVIRSFSTEHDDEMQLNFDEPKKKPSRSGGGNSAKRASRIKRTASAPEHSPRKGSVQADSDSSLLSPKKEAYSPSISGPNSPSGCPDDVDPTIISVDEPMPEEPPPEKPKKRKYTRHKLENLECTSPKDMKLVIKISRGKKLPKDKDKVNTLPTPAVVKLKSRKAMRPALKPSMIRIRPSRKDLSQKFKLSPKKLTLPMMKHVKSSIRTNLPSSSKALRPDVPKPDSSTKSQLPLRQQKKWLPRREISRNMIVVRSGIDNPIKPFVDGPELNKSPESPTSKLKPTESHQKTKSKKREEEIREEQELVQYTTGFSCLEELLDGRGKVILPELFHVMIRNLSETLTGKHLLGLLGKNRNRDEIRQLLEETSQKSNGNGFQPFCRIGAVLEDKPSTSYPLITEEELDAYETLVNLGQDFECWDDELECGNLFVDLIEMDLRTMNNCSVVKNAVPTQSDDQKLLKTVHVKAIPVTYYEAQNDQGLVIPEDDFKNLFLNKKKDHQELTVRSLRSGKKVELVNMKLEETKKIRVKRKRRKIAKIVPELPLDCPSFTDKDKMNLRSGKKVEYKPIDTAELLQPSIKLELVSEAMKVSPVKPLQQDDYSKRVEADLRKLEEGEDLLFFDLNNQAGTSLVSSQNVVRGPFDPLYIDNLSLGQVPVPGSVPEPLNNGTSSGSVARVLFGPGPSVPSTSSPLPPRPLPPQSQYFFKPIQPQPSSALFSDSASVGSTGSPRDSDIWGRPEFSSPFLPSDQFGSEMREHSQVRKPYSRHRHARICPPFENNHCSFSEHFCSYPRATGSRFCLQHVAEGATVNFDRCKYVKGSRECGRFIPKKAQFQSVFCDMHARAVAKARLKKMKPAKPSDPSVILLRDIKRDLDRTKSKFVEDVGNGYQRVRPHFLAEDYETLNNSSDSDTDDEFVVNDYKKNQVECDSDLEDDCASGLDYNLLKHAGYYTVMEIVHIYRSKLETLNKLYLRQLELLKKKYVDYRKEFLRKTQAFRQLRSYITTDPKYISQTEGEYSEEYLQHQIRTTQETRAFLKHGRNTGKRAVLHMEMMKKRQLMVDSGKAQGRGRPRKLNSASTETEKEIRAREIEYFAKRSRKWKRNRGPICSFGLLGGEKCSEKAFPLSKYCRKHVSHDKNQKLLNACNSQFGPDPEDVCKNTTLTEIEKLGCHLHSLPIPIKDPPDDDKKPKIEAELTKLMEKLENSFSSSTNEEDFDSEEDMIREMEDLVGDEVVDLDHFQEVVKYLHNKGLDLTDTEESDDTEEEDDQEKA